MPKESSSFGTYLVVKVFSKLLETREVGINLSDNQNLGFSIRAEGCHYVWFRFIYYLSLKVEQKIKMVMYFTG